MENKRLSILWKSMTLEPPNQTKECLCKTNGTYFISTYDVKKKDWLSNGGVPLDKWMPGYKDVMEVRKGSFITFDDLETLMRYEYERLISPSQE